MSGTAAEGEINGLVPQLRGLVCEAFLCQSYWFNGREIDPANVTYVRFGGAWHRLYFDMGIIFWRPSDDPPDSWEEPSEGWSYPVVDVGSAAGVVGVRLDDLAMSWDGDDAAVTFRFANQRRIVVDYRVVEDVTTYHMIVADPEVSQRASEKEEQ